MPETVAVVSAVNPYPSDAGKKVVLAGFLDYLNDRVGPTNVHYLMVGGSEQNDGFPAEFHPIPKPRALAAVGSVLARTGTGRASLQESLLHTAEVRQSIHRTLDRISPSLEIYDTVRMTQFARAQSGQRQVCYLDDLFSERYRAMLIASDRYRDVDIQPLGNFATHVPSRLRPLADGRRSQRLLLRMEEHLVRRSEDRNVGRYSAAVLLNAHEADLLRRRAGSQAHRVATVPPLISAPVYRREYGGAPEFVFLGLLSLPHNEDGLRSFLTNVWPSVLAARPDARLRVVGRNPRQGLLDLIARFADSVILEGYVPDLTELLGRAAALVNPLRFGSGVKLKIIEALGAGLPVISTAIGADGVADGPEQGVLVVEDSARWTELLTSATDPRLNARLSEAAREHFLRSYSREAVFARYDAVFGCG